MHGLEEIKKMNSDPDTYQRSQLSDGQERREDSPPSNYWSEHEPNAAAAIAGPVREQMDPVDFNIAEMQVPSQFLHRDSPLTLAQALREPAPVASEYFEAIKLWHVLARRASQLQEQHRALKTRIRLYRSAVSDQERDLMLHQLKNFMSDLLSDNETGASLKVEMLVDDLVKQVDITAPPNPKGYVPHMGLHYAMRPIRNIINSILQAFKRED